MEFKNYLATKIQTKCYDVVFSKKVKSITCCSHHGLNAFQGLHEEQFFLQLTSASCNICEKQYQQIKCLKQSMHSHIYRQVKNYVKEKEICIHSIYSTWFCSEAAVAGFGGTAPFGNISCTTCVTEGTKNEAQWIRLSIIQFLAS